MTMSSHQQQVAEHLNRNLDPGPAQIRLGYVGTSPDVRTPLSRVVQGNRSAREGVVRLRLHLSLLWLADDRGRVPALKLWEWATLIGLDDPLGKGASRVRESLAWMTEAHLVIVEPRSLRVKDERWNGLDYRTPSLKMAELRQDNDRYPAGHVHLKLSPALWTDGWITRMSARSLMAYLILLHRRAYNHFKHNSRSQGVRLPNHLYPEIYSVPAATAKTGIAELEELGLVTRSLARDRNYRTATTYHPSTLEDATCPPQPT